MLRIIQNVSAAAARSYYSTSDYFTEGQELQGVWRGKAAARLGHSGVVEQKQWDALCENRDPETGRTLTARRKAERRVGYDFNFHVPKSVSLLYAVTQDERLLDAFRGAVDDTMNDMEAEMKTRVRRNGRDEDRTTGNMVWGEFVHFTSRPIDGVPDPHLHAHCFVFNTTYDGEESRWKAGQFAPLKRDAGFHEAVFHSRLAYRLADLSLPVERTATGWEVGTLSRATLDKFSRRTVEVEARAAAQGITDPAEKAELGAKTRARKAKHLSPDELRRHWLGRLTDGERKAIDELAARLGGTPTQERADQAKRAVEWAAEHCFERQSVVPERKLLAVAIKRGIGESSHPAVLGAYQSMRWITARRNDERVVTTPKVLAEESRMLAFARQGRGTRAALCPGEHAFTRTWLNDGQRRAVKHVLHSRDAVTLVRGAAGTGKTSMMREAVEAIEAAGTKVLTFAPSAEASRGVLRAEGFETADTVSRLLVDTAMQEAAQGQVLWVDEAGLLSMRMTTQLFDVAQRLDARVILSGDRRQHGSVERGSALRLLEEEAGLKPAVIREIQRQKADYKQAVLALSEGRVEEGFRRLNDLGWIRETPDETRYQSLAADYVAAVLAGQSALVVSPSHVEGGRCTAAIRDSLRRAGKLGQDEQCVPTLLPVNLTEAERGDKVNVAPGDVIEFHQNAKGFRKASG